MAYTTIDKGSKYFNTVLYTGDGSFPSSKTGVGFAPDFIWIKRRSATASHVISDIIRGTTKTLYTDSTSAELTSNTYGWVSSFNSDGFSVDQSGSSGENVNASGSTYCAWNWLANGTGVSNTSGTITSTVSANTTSGFSIVSYTGTGANATVGHGLGVAPKMVIIKNRTSAENWRVGHSSLTSWAYRLILDSTSAQTSEPNAFNSTAPTSTVFSVGIDDSTNKSTNSLIAYCFAEVKGYSKFGSYTGNGSTDGTFVYTGFKPAYVMVKASSTTGQWAICDNKRGAANILNNNGEFLFAENSDATNSAPSNWDFLSNGFKARANYAANNTSGVTYIYMAFAENPFVSSTLIPTTAR